MNEKNTHHMINEGSENDNCMNLSNMKEYTNQAKFEDMSGLPIEKYCFSNINYNSPTVEIFSELAKIQKCIEECTDIRKNLKIEQFENIQQIKELDKKYESMYTAPDVVGSLYHDDMFRALYQENRNKSRLNVPIYYKMVKSSDMSNNMNSLYINSGHCFKYFTILNSIKKYSNKLADLTSSDFSTRCTINVNQFTKLAEENIENTFPLVRSILATKLKKQLLRRKQCLSDYQSKYCKLAAQWQHGIKLNENNSRKRLKELKQRDLYERVFPELRGIRQDVLRLNRADNAFSHKKFSKTLQSQCNQNKVTLRSTQTVSMRSNDSFSSGSNSTNNNNQHSSNVANFYDSLLLMSYNKKSINDYRNSAANVPPAFKSKYCKFWTNYGFLKNKQCVKDPSENFNYSNNDLQWSPKEKKTFLDGIAQFGKSFEPIKNKLPHKTLKQVIYHYHLIKCSDALTKKMKQFRSEKYRKNKNKDGNVNGPTINMEMCSLRLCKCQKRPKRFSTINFIWKDLSNINKTWLLNNYGLDKDTKRCCFSCFVGINHYLNNNKCTYPEPKEEETNVIENEIVKVHKRRKRRNRKMKHKVPSKTLKTTKSENLCVNDKVKELNISESSIYSSEKCFDKLESNNNDISIKEEKSSNYSGVEENSIAALSSNSIEDVSKCEFECKQSKSDTDSGGISKNFKNKTNTFKNILLDHYEPISDQE